MKNTLCSLVTTLRKVEIINADQLARQMEILAVAGLLVYIYKQTSDLFALLIALAILFFDCVSILRRSLEEIIESTDSSGLFAAMVLKSTGAVIAIWATISIALDFAGSH